MNILEAIKSGCRYRMVGEKKWRAVDAVYTTPELLGIYEISNVDNIKKLSKEQKEDKEKIKALSKIVAGRGRYSGGVYDTCCEISKITKRCHKRTLEIIETLSKINEYRKINKKGK